MKLNFYDVDNDYTVYLRKFDKKIPYICYSQRDKFLCGIVLTINQMNYYVPVSSNTTKYMSSFIIYDEKGKKDKISIASLRFSFMFPCLIETIVLKNLKIEKDKKYRGLTQKEYIFCNKNIARIKKESLSNL